MPATTFRSIIELWASKEAMASDIGAKAPAVSKWWQRDSIPAEWWSAVLDTAVAKSAGLTAAMMTALASRAAGGEVPEPAEART